MDYNFQEIESKWQKYWIENRTYQVEISKDKPKYYVLDMFPYPSGAGLHVGHPLGYIASDIYSRYKRLKGFNVLHPMGYDAFGLPAEQYAIQTGQHPAITTEKNIRRYREQMDKIGFCYDWNREVRTCDPQYYHWTQWAFIQMFHHWYNKNTQRAEPISKLIETFEKEGNAHINAATDQTEIFTATQWKEMSERQQQTTLLRYRLAYQADIPVNWCPTLGTVLANDEVKDGLSVRGGHPVFQKEMRQWCLRISAYAQRLLDGLDKIDWSDALKEIQRNWIGRSDGAEMLFPVKDSSIKLEIFTTRADTIFGVTFMVLSPESILVDQLTTASQKEAVAAYRLEVSKRTERERIADTRKTGVFTGSYAVNPLTHEEIPIWVSDYVLAGYGTGAIMAVPGHDTRDFAFARTFGLPIKQVVVPKGQSESDPATWKDAIDSYEGTMVNSGFITGLEVPEAIRKTAEYIEQNKIGKVKVNYRLRDAIFSRQRYWGEPFPIYYKDGTPYTIPENELPLKLPEVDKYLPTEEGEPPLARAQNWKTKEGHPYEFCTMPGFAGSSAYYLRYMDPHNNQALVNKEVVDYWRSVDLYMGGSEHATGHLIYARFWNKFLYDLGIIPEDEPFKKLINQGMIQGRSNFVYRVKNTNKFVSYNLRQEYETQEIHVDISLVHNDILNIESFRNWRPEFQNAEFILEDEKYVCGYAVEKMSKSMYNVVNPDDIIIKYGADTLRMYEMFLGPIEVSKPWDTNGIDGVHKFLRKFWNLFFGGGEQFTITQDEPSREELKTLHRTIEKVTSDIEKFSFNTSVSTFMICVNELTSLKCNKRAILEPLTILIAPFAPHIAEELWHRFGHKDSVTTATFPICNEEYLIENVIVYPVTFNGKRRYEISVPANAPTAEVEKAALIATEAAKWLAGKQPKKIIVVPGKIVNVVI